MQFVTEDGRNVSVGLHHVEVVIPRYPEMKCKRTIMRLKAEGNKQFPPVDIEQHVTCNPKTQFCRKTGRKLVREKFLPIFEQDVVNHFDADHYDVIATAPKRFFTRHDRTIIYSVLLPEFTRKNKKIRKKLARIEQVEATLASLPAK